jgi:ubiquinone/menaquinone biosynthesis C-methylase UbiE
MKLFKKTKEHKKYWSERKIDWKTQYFDTHDHPHRKILVDILKNLPWMSLLEIGCASGPNLAAILKAIPNRQLGGVDISADAIELAQKTFKGGFFKVNSADDIMMSDKSTDIVLSDMTLIYVDKKDINRYIKEIKRIARNYILLSEFHSKSWWNRLTLKWNSGYNAYDWERLLKKHGFRDVALYKIKESEWPGGNPQKTFGYIILARVPKY